MPKRLRCGIRVDDESDEELVFYREDGTVRLSAVSLMIAQKHASELDPEMKV